MRRNSQVATEYVVISGIVIVIAVVGAFALGLIPGIGSDSEERVEKSEYLTQEVAVERYAIEDDGSVFLLRNNFRRDITVSALSIEGIRCTTSELPDTLKQGEFITVNCDVNSTNVTQSVPSIGILWTNLLTNQEFQTQYGNTDTNWTVPINYWDPGDVTTLAWYDASDAATIINDSSGNVTQWNDKSGNGYDLDQSNKAVAPITGTRTLNGLNILDFQDRYIRNTSWSAPADGNFTVYIVGFADAVGDAADSMYSITNGNGAAGYRFRSGSASHWRATYQAYSGEFSSNVDHNLPALSLDTEIWQLEFNNTGAGTVTGFITGDSPVVRTYNDPIDISTTNSITMGARIPTGSNRLEGAIAEFVIARDIGNDTTKKMEGYLAHKWGLEGNLPGGHPYELEPPIN